MSLLTTVPNYPVHQDMPFLLQVKFDEYAKRLAGVSGEAVHCHGAVAPEAAPPPAGQDPTRALLTRYVGLNGRLTELHTVLASAGVNSMWIRGEAGTGKTALADEFIRARTDKRLSSSMFGGPFFLFNVSMFLTSPPLSWVDGFNKSLEYVKRNHGLLIIDHIDDLVKSSGEASDRMMQSLLACLESNADVQAIIISDTKNNGAITSSATGILRCFQVMETEEQSLDSLKSVLMSHFHRLSSVHNIDYSEPVADEIVRLLGRYPGRAFTSSKRPEKAISFADKVGAMVRINVFAEPIELAELRDQIGALRDRLDVTRGGKAASASIEEQLVTLQARYCEVDQQYKNRFGPYIKAKNALDDIESRLGSIESKPRPDRTPEERRDFNTLMDGLLPARGGSRAKNRSFTRFGPTSPRPTSARYSATLRGFRCPTCPPTSLTGSPDWSSTSARRFSLRRRP